MATRGQLRRTDRALDPHDAEALLQQAQVVRLGAVDPEGWPYVVPLSFVYDNGDIYFHHTAEDSHLSASLAANPRVCIEVDEAGPVFPGEESACSAGRTFHSVIAFGTVTIVTDPDLKDQAFHRLFAKYADPAWGTPSTFPKRDTTLVYRVSLETITGKALLRA